MKKYLLLFFLIVVVAILFVVKFSWKPVFHDQPESKSTFGLPVALIIPSINVNSKIQYLGITSQGELEVPNNIYDVGWFKFGPHPGENGSAVIAGHLNGTNGKDGVFVDLSKLKTGDKMSVIDDKGTITSFTVREIRTYSPGFAEEVFNSNDAPHLNLITCDGVWNGAIKSYDKRLVVFADK